MPENFESNFRCLLVNITWNSNNWISESIDKSNHRYIKEGGTAHESWNFDFDNKRNTNLKIYGYAQFSKSPDIKGDNNLIVFCSSGKIVGFYGKAEIFKEYQNNKNGDYNLSGEKSLSLALNNKIDNIKEKGYLEDLQRIGQIGFSYLKKNETIFKIIDEAIKLNPDQLKIKKLKEWLELSISKNDNTFDIDRFAQDNTIKEVKLNMSEYPLNQILYGPPGTGKTYNTINKAIEIINPAFDLSQDRNIVKEEYDKLVNEGRIVFTTFHQSMSYEDFIEGIKPIEPENQGQPVIYKVESGIFKNHCENLKNKEKLSLNDDFLNKASFFKVSLGDYTKIDDNNIYNYCIENNCIALGWGSDIDFTGVKNKEQIKEKCKNLDSEDNKNYTATAIESFILKLKKGDIVLISKGNKYIRAIGIIDGDYQFKNTQEIRYFQFRSVKWLLVDQDIQVRDIYKKNLIQQSIYQLDKNSIKLEYFKQKNDEKFVFIIDEINRGNVSQIFGELITLIEDDKRLGKSESLEITLPYSKEKFGVPDNLYIIGTMNTADRSVEALDTALRRRFHFEEMPPRYDLNELEKEIANYKLSDILKTINQRIEKLLNKDHLIGHSFFIKVDSIKSLEETFYKNIIPLLQEYFFGDYGKIGLVLGKSFVIKKTEEKDLFADFEYDELESLNEKVIYEIIDYRNPKDHTTYKEKNNLNFQEAIKKMMPKKS